MNIKDVRIRQGATFERTFTDTDMTADTLTVTMSNDSGVVASDTASYVTVDDERVATVSVVADMPLGEYEYMYTITYTDGFVIKLPDSQGYSDGSCDLPILTICEANDEMTS